MIRTVVATLLILSLTAGCAMIARHQLDQRYGTPDPSRYDTYLEQLGIEYPTIRTRPISEQDQGGR